jgi:hypothetical protein
VHQVRSWYSGVELKFSRRQGGPSQTGGRREHILNRYVIDPAAAGQPPAHFQLNPLGRAGLRFWGPAIAGLGSTRISLDTGLRSRGPKWSILQRRRYTSFGLVQ